LNLPGKGHPCRWPKDPIGKEHLREREVPLLKDPDLFFLVFEALYRPERVYL
jgi:hypothetical protein